MSKIIPELAIDGRALFKSARFRFEHLELELSAFAETKFIQLCRA